MNSFGDDPIEFLMNVTKEVSSVLKCEIAAINSRAL